MKKSLPFIVLICFQTQQVFSQKIECGAFHSLSVCEDNTAQAWGRNDIGQLGDLTKIDKHAPAQMNQLTGIIDIEGGWGHSLALKNDGTRGVL